MTNDLQTDLNNLKSYIASPWLRNRHLMTMATAFLRPPNALSPISKQALIVPVTNESAVLAYAYIDKRINRCLTLVHGLEGSSESTYILNLAATAIAFGFNVVRLNLRNCGNTLHLTPTLYNAGQSEDLIKVIDWLKEKLGQSEQYIVGYSLGGNLVLKALAELSNKDHVVKGGCGVSPSIDLAASVDCLSTGINRIYDHFFLYSLKRKIALKHRLFPERYDLKTLSRVHSMRQFDELFTAPDSGYNNAQDYYQAASAMQLINQIKIKTLIITAQDDPLVPFRSFANFNNTNVKLLAPKHGGHASFIGTDRTYVDQKQNSFWSVSQILSFCNSQSQTEANVICLT